MKSGASRSGYTIIEVLIYLVVTGALMATAILLIGGQQGRAQFSVAVRDFDSQLQDVLNDVSTGVYPGNDNINCQLATLPASGIQFSNGPKPEGSNQDCIFIGRALQFNTNELGADTYRIYTIAGLRQLYNPAVAPSLRKEVTTLSEAQPKLVAIYSGGLTANDITELNLFRFGLEVTKIVTKTGAQTARGIAFISSFAKYNSNSDPISGAQNVNLYALDTGIGGGAFTGPNSTGTVDDFANSIAGLGITNTANIAQTIAREGVVICLQSSGDSNKTASITIGGNQGQLTTELKIDNIEAICTS